MPKDRFFEPSPFHQGNTIILKDKERHHLNVMRIKLGDTLELVNGKGALALAYLEKLTRDKAYLSLQQVKKKSEPKQKLVLLQAIPKLNRLDTLVEKATELGVSTLALFPGEKSPKKTLSSPQLNRLVQITIAAMKQCGRLFLPKLHLLKPVKEWNAFKEATFFGDLSPTAPPLFNQLQTVATQTIQIVIGPESGFSKEEEKKLIELGGIGVSLGPHILRTETAAIYSLSLIHHWVYTQIS